MKNKKLLLATLAIALALVMTVVSCSKDSKSGGGNSEAGGDGGTTASETGVGTTGNTRDGNMNDDGIFAVAYGSGKFIVGGSEGKMAASTDGETWTGVPDSPISIRAIAFGNSRFVAIGNDDNWNNKIAYLAD